MYISGLVCGFWMGSVGRIKLAWALRVIAGVFAEVEFPAIDGPDVDC